jgi:hypothetical protein
LVIRRLLGGRKQAGGGFRRQLFRFDLHLDQFRRELEENCGADKLVDFGGEFGGWL